ncbi:MAG: hypothetical protein M0R70_06055 [Nitrospirae bacterium]|nr:hypothetical protein [Nitrospirota bacterium]
MLSVKGISIPALDTFASLRTQAGLAIISILIDGTGRFVVNNSQGESACQVKLFIMVKKEIALPFATNTE